MKRFLLASFDYLRKKDPNISLASSSILAHLKSNSNNSLNILSRYEIFHRQYDVKKKEIGVVRESFLNDVAAIRPDIIGTGVYIWNEAFVKDCFDTMKFKKDNGKILTILGGPQITYNPKGTLESSYPYGDIFIRGYAEESLALLLESLNQALSYNCDIDGVHWRGDRDKGLKSVYNLSSLPSPLLTPGIVQHNGYIRLETKRGCPFSCAFCQHKDSYEKRLACSSYRIEKEIEAIISQGITDISIVDPIFNSGQNYSHTLEQFIKKGYKGRLSLQSRFEMIKDDYIEACVKLLNGGASVELEFGIQTIIPSESKVIRRANNLKKVVQAAQALRDRKINFEVSLIYGLPLQTKDSFMSSLEWVQQFLKPERIDAWALMLLKGTEMWDLRDNFSLRERILDEDLEEVDEKRIYAGIPHVVESSTFTENEWNEMKNIALSINS